MRKVQPTLSHFLRIYLMVVFKNLNMYKISITSNKKKFFFFFFFFKIGTKWESEIAITSNQKTFSRLRLNGNWK